MRSVYAEGIQDICVPAESANASLCETIPNSPHNENRAAKQHPNIGGPSFLHVGERGTTFECHTQQVIQQHDIHQTYMSCTESPDYDIQQFYNTEIHADTSSLGIDLPSHLHKKLTQNSVGMTPMERFQTEDPFPYIHQRYHSSSGDATSLSNKYAVEGTSSHNQQHDPISPDLIHPSLDQYHCSLGQYHCSLDQYKSSLDHYNAFLAQHYKCDANASSFDAQADRQDILPVPLEQLPTIQNEACRCGGVGWGSALAGTGSRFDHTDPADSSSSPK